MGIEKLKEFWPQWQILGEIGRGSFGTVYKAMREEHGVTSYSAIKVISIPQQDAEIKSLKADGLDDAATKNYFENIVANTVGEIKVLESMKGTSNIVSVEDYKVAEATGRIGWDIFIRMELLTTFIDYAADKKFDEAMVIKLGVDICSALELCAKRNIIHRDVKPENIFVSQFGDFKIGDFGIARELERSSGSLSVSGTHNYMAPEVQSKKYDGTVDIYSLGIVLYKLLNNNRLPFLDPNVQMVNPQDYHAALDRRFAGEDLPDPVNASPALARVISVACSFDPAKRFKTATAFKNALSSVTNGMAAVKIAPTRPASAISVRPVNQGNENPNGPEKEIKIGAKEDVANAALQTKADKVKLSKNKTTNPKPKDKHKKPKIIAIAILVVILAVGGLYGWNWLQDKIDPANDVLVALDNGDADGALAIFRNDMKGESNSKLETGLMQRLDTIDTDYKANTIDYESASEKINTIETFGITGVATKLSGIKTGIDTLNKSRFAFEAAVTFQDGGDYLEAIEQYRLVIESDENFAAAQDGIQQCSDEYRSEEISAAEKAASSGDYTRAMEIIDDALKILVDDTQLLQKKTLYEAKYVLKAIADADALAKQGKHDDAVTLLQNASKSVPGNEDMAGKITEIQNSKPATLSEIKLIDSQKYEQKTDIFEDSFGNKYYESFEFNPATVGYSRSKAYYNSENKFSEYHSYAVYNVNNQYKTISADIVAQSGLDSNAIFLIEIYKDDGREPVWSTADYTVRTGAKNFSVDVSGATKITVAVWVKNDTYRGDFPIRLVNTSLSR